MPAVEEAFLDETRDGTTNSIDTHAVFLGKLGNGGKPRAYRKRPSVDAAPDHCGKGPESGPVRCIAKRVAIGHETGFLPDTLMPVNGLTKE